MPVFVSSSKAAENTYGETIFPEDKVSTIEIEIDESDFQNLLDNAIEEEYYPANIVINGNRLNNVGIRAKGNSSLTRVVQDNDSDRYSFKIKTDKYQSQSLGGLTKLNLNNCYTDPSYMREYISYTMMKEMGVPTPEFAYMEITINGELWGLYLAVEAIEEPFLQNNFTSWTGDLYKPERLSWNMDSSEIEENITAINLKTNTATSNYSALKSFVEAINSGDNLDDVMNVEEFITYFAVNTTLVDTDSYQGNNLHNYYLYEENGMFSILPWDYDLSFGVFGADGGGRGGQKPPMEENQREGETNRENEIAKGQLPQQDKQIEGENLQEQPTQLEGAKKERGGGSGGMSQINLTDSVINFPIDTPVSGYDVENYPLIYSWLSKESYKEQYHQTLENLVDTYFNKDYMEDLVNKTTALISEHVANDPNAKHSYDDFVAGYQDILTFTELRSESILKQLAGETSSTGERTNASNGDMMENAGNAELAPQNREGGMPNFREGESGRPSKKGEEIAGVNYKVSFILLGSGVLLILVLIVFIKRYSRRGR